MTPRTFFYYFWGPRYKKLFMVGISPLKGHTVTSLLKYSHTAESIDLASAKLTFSIRISKYVVVWFKVSTLRVESVLPFSARLFLGVKKTPTLYNLRVNKISSKLEIQKLLKEYLPNLLETWLLHQIFVFWVRDLKFWLLAYLFFW